MYRSRFCLYAIAASLFFMTAGLPSSALAFSEDRIYFGNSIVGPSSTEANVVIASALNLGTELATASFELFRTDHAPELQSSLLMGLGLLGLLTAGGVGRIREGVAAGLTEVRYQRSLRE